MPTIRDVARESGVSVATVSYVINNGPRTVAPATRARVVRVMELLDYHPNALARGLARRRSDAIGVLCSLPAETIMSNPYLSTILSGVLAGAEAAGLSVTLCNGSWDETAIEELRLRDARVDGFVVVAPPCGEPLARALRACGVPFVVVSAPADMFGAPAVDVANGDGARLATEHLIELGHRRIGHIGGEALHCSAASRRRGFERAMAAAGLGVDAQTVNEGPYELGSGYERALVMLALPDRPTAIVAGNDMIALGVLKAARELGLAVPRELSVVGFDDVQLAAMVTPSLTTVRQPLTDIGRASVEMLAQMLCGAELSAETRQMVPELIVRESAGAAPVG